MSTALRLNAAEYDTMVSSGAFSQIGKRVELIRGEIREMCPAGPVHDDLIAWLSDWSYQVTRDQPIQVRSQTGMRMDSQDSRHEPDVFWVRARRYLDRHPSASDTLLAIEVSDSSLQEDIREKAPLYAEAGIRECWIVNVQNRCVHVFTQPVKAQYQAVQIVGIDQSVSPLILPEAMLVVRDLFAE